MVVQKTVHLIRCWAVRKIYGKGVRKVGMVAAIIRVIVTAMVASGMTPQEIADKARVPVNTVYRMRKGYLIRLDKFGRICEALDIKPEDVIDYQRLVSHWLETSS